MAEAEIKIEFLPDTDLDDANIIIYIPDEEGEDVEDAKDVLAAVLEEENFWVMDTDAFDDKHYIIKIIGDEHDIEDIQDIIKKFFNSKGG